MLLGARAVAQNPPDEADVKAAFVYNFLKFVEWPSGTFARPNDPLVVAIVGKGPTAVAAERFLSAKQVGERLVVVRHLEPDEPLTGVHALFVSESNPKEQQRILGKTASESILSIGEGAEFATRGGVIALLIENHKVRFDINTAAADSARLKVSSKLLAVSRVIHSFALHDGVRVSVTSRRSP
jgi:hypothetical protein